MSRFLSVLLALVVPCAAVADGDDSLGLSFDLEIDGGVVWSDGVGIAQRYGNPTSMTQTIDASAIPSNAIVQHAWLYWVMLGAADDTALIDGTEVVGDPIGHCEDTAWNYNGSAGNYAFRADVGSLVQGPGKYAISGFDWQIGQVDNQGASLVVVYSVPGTQTAARIRIADGAMRAGGGVDTAEFTFTGLSIPKDLISARIVTIVGDGQAATDGPLTYAGHVLDDNDVFCGPDCVDGDGAMWDDTSWDVTKYTTPSLVDARIAIADPAIGSSDFLVLTAAIHVSAFPNDNPDSDGDGFVESIDCDDTDPAINPGVPEICDDNVDNDCDGDIDLDDDECATDDDTGDDDTGDDDTGDDDTSDDDTADDDDGEEGDCSCSLGSMSAGSLWLVLLGISLGVLRRRP